MLVTLTCCGGVGDNDVAAAPAGTCVGASAKWQTKEEEEEEDKMAKRTEPIYCDDGPLGARPAGVAVAGGIIACRSIVVCHIIKKVLFVRPVRSNKVHSGKMENTEILLLYAPRLKCICCFCCVLLFVFVTEKTPKNTK